ncbi:MAG: YggS family pyridoxal phosphate-dependent enzyme [Actinobacteria bacterium]|nr:YggS family pyridoxal phosphate-dependent enzyme [Actinomycetota bacterium]
MSPVDSLAERLADAQQKISAAAEKCDRANDDIKLIVVTKNHPTQLVFDLLDLGMRDFGENRDQEAAPKAAEVRAASTIEHHWHFIGQLQSNKVKSVVSYASSIHSLDRQSLLDALGKATIEREVPLDVFIQLNLTDDPGRGGIQPANLRPFAENVLTHPGLNLVGVMGVAALDNNLERDFGAIRAASESLRTLKPEASLISAGMSEDFETAIAFGATHLRIGSAITGKRQY